MNAAPLTDATGTRRMLRALGCDGYSTARIATELGQPARTVHNWHRHHRIEPHVAQAVADLYTRWAGIPAETNGSASGDAEQTRIVARQRRWAPASAWDGDEITDPQAVPASWRTTWRAEDLHAEAEPLLAAGVPIDVAAAQLGVKVATLQRARERTRARARERATASAVT
jgi:hypothetical protein